MRRFIHPWGDERVITWRAAVVWTLAVYAIGVGVGLALGIGVG